jgi:hypothetical protein
MKLIVNLFVSIIHFILTYSIFTFALISNNIKTLFILLVIMSIIKILYCLFGRCILTLYEYNEYFAPLAKMMSNTLSPNLEDKISEEIMINIGLLIILNKLLVLFFLNYYKIKL